LRVVVGHARGATTSLLVPCGLSHKVAHMNVKQHLGPTSSAAIPSTTQSFMLTPLRVNTAARVPQKHTQAIAAVHKQHGIFMHT
jgi:hypothetical protein